MTKQVLAFVQTLFVTMSLLLVANKLNSQTDEQLLQEAIRVVREFVGDQSFTPLFTDEESRISFFEGPYRIFSFSWVPGYLYIKVRVNPSPILVAGWCKTDDAWLPYVNTNLPEKSNDELIAIARNYASQHFPGWQDFSHWQGRIRGRVKDSGYGKTVRSYLVSFCPYFVNGNGDKIIFAPAGCNVRLESYEGKVVSFNWWYNSIMTLSSNQLNPKFTPLEAEVLAEQKVRNWIASILAQEGYSIPSNVVFEATLSDPNDPDQGWWGDSRLVIGATETSGLRLAYRIDKIQAKDVNTGETLDEWNYALIDAHTGELLVLPQRVAGLHDRFPLATRQNLFIFAIRSFGIWVSILVTILASILLTLLFRRIKR
ncbi:MAG: hypothetical protein NZ937_07715 [Armatimonadetes bacterium]|nr:hypothetical protein [Armatimonadota bacterium]